MNKKGETLTITEIIEATISVILILILVSVGYAVYGAFHKENNQVEKKDLLRLVSEIKDLKSEGEIIVPTFTHIDYEIEAFKVDDLKKSVYNKCTKDYCICFKNLKSAICETFDLDKKEFNYEGDFVKFSSEEKVIANETVKLSRNTDTKTPTIKLSNPKII